jgi:membrane-associated phospholipid phosphatase
LSGPDWNQAQVAPAQSPETLTAGAAVGTRLLGGSTGPPPGRGRWLARLACDRMRARDHVTAVPAAGQRRRWGLPPRGPSAPLLPAATRRPAASVALCCLVLVVALGLLFARQSHGSAIDHAVDSWVMGLHIRNGTLELISRLGNLPAVTVMTGALAIACLVVRKLTGALLAVLGLLIASGLTEDVLKPLVHRTITVNHFLTYPSGHTTVLFALSTALAVVLLNPRSDRPRPAVRTGAVALAVVVSCLVAMAMIGLDFHYFTDTIAGAAVGIGAVLGTAFVLDIEVIRRLLGRLSR